MVKEMVERKAPAGGKNRKASVLQKLQPAEAQEVLGALLEAHTELRKEAEGIARSLLPSGTP